MKNKKHDPFEDLVLDAYEKELEDAIPENAVLPKITDEEKQIFAKAAVKHKRLKVSKRINIRINNYDLARVKAKAKVNSIPYQTLLSSLIHKYAKGELKLAI